MDILISFIFGLAVGSLLNVLIFRFDPDKEDFSFLRAMTGRSRCPFCKKLLAWFELIPLFSFLLQKRRCRSCAQLISWQYPVVELLTGLIFATLTWRFAQDFVLIPFWMIIASILIVISFIDIKHYLIPDQLLKLLLIIVIFWLVFQLAGSSIFNFQFPSFGYLGYYQFLFPQFGQSILNYLFGSFVFGGLLFLIALLTGGRAMGMGDVKLMALAGLTIPWPAVFLAFLFSFLSGTLVSIFLMLFWGKSFKSKIAFGPFIGLGMILTVLFGEQILNIYFGVTGL